MKNILKKKFPDVHVQHLTLNQVYSRADVEKKVTEFAEMFGEKVIAYECSGTKLSIYTSCIFTQKLESLKKGDNVLEPHTGKVGVIVSEKPFFCACNLCVRVDFGGTDDVYDCRCFM